MKPMIFAALAVLSLGTSVFGLDVPAQFKKEWKAMKPGSRAYVQFTTTRKYIAGCKADPNDPPFRPKAFSWDYVTKDENKLIGDAEFTYITKHPNGIPKAQADADPPAPPEESSVADQHSDLGFDIPGQLVGKWKSLKPGTKAYRDFVATRKYLQECVKSPKNPPAKLADLDWDDTIASETDVVADCVSTYDALH
jgi:hypothetical protein